MNAVQECIQELKNRGMSDTNELNSRSLRIINKIFRKHDNSSLWPICGRFSATDCAIRWYSRIYHNANGYNTAYEYMLGLERKISDIVNLPNL